MFCEKCGTKNDDNATICKNCGAALPINPIQTQVEDSNTINNSKANISENTINEDNTYSSSTQVKEKESDDSVNQSQQLNNQSEQFNNNPSQFNNQPQQFNNNPSQFNNQPQQFNNNPSQFNNQPQQFNNNPSQFNNQPQQFNNNPSQFNNQPQQFNNNPSQFNNQPQQFNTNAQKFNNNPSQFNTQNQVSLKKKKSFPIWLLILIIVIAVIIIGSLTFFFVAKNKSDPKNLVKRYTNAILTCDYDTAYSMVDKNDISITSDQYSDYLEKNVNDQVITKVNTRVIELPQKNIADKNASNKVYKDFDVTFNGTSSMLPDDMTVTLVKQPQKQYLFFDTYKVCIDDIITDNYTVVAPKDAKITIDDVPLQADPGKQSDTDSNYGKLYSTFTGPKIIKGSHDVVILSKYIEQKENKEDIDDDTELTYTDIKVPDEDVANLKNEASQFASDLINYACQGKDFSELKSKYAVADNSQSESDFNKIKDDFVTYKFTSLTVTKCDITSTFDSSDNDTLSLEIFYTLDYDYSVGSYNGNSSVYDTLKFAHTDDKWVIQ